MQGADREDKLAGAILGAAVGDALGLPREGLSPSRASRLFGDDLEHRFLFHRGMASDDTEHTCMVAQALLARPDDPEAFARSLGWRFRAWLLGLPAGVGLATLRAILKLWVGFPPGKSGVRSAGNGPAMRSAVIGACFPGDVERIRSFVSASTRITHTDPKAERGALAVALGAGYAAGTRPGTLNPQEVLDFLREHLEDGELLSQAGENPRNGISGYMYHTVPAALSCWLRHPHDFRAAVSDVIRLGGDADTTGSIVGALSGATLGASAIPKEWLDRLWEWPRTVGWMRRLACRLGRQFPAGGNPEQVGPAGLFWPALPLRNLVFLAAVLAHGFRRLLPPY